MLPSQAFELAYQTASSGYFFDGMEMIAAVAPAAGGIDNLRGGIELLFPERDRVNAQMDTVAAMVGGAFGSDVPAPRTVDAYRTLMKEGVFEIVNRWSYIADINQVNQLQAWFYAGFGLGRAETVVKGLRLLERLRDIVGGIAPLDQMPTNLQRMSAEAAKQMETAAEEDDLRTVRPLFEDCAARLKHLALVTQKPLDAIAWDPDWADDLDAFEETARKVRMDFTKSAN